MTRTPLPYSAGDISALARSLRTQLAARQGMPGHVELLNMLAKAAGHRNFQHFRAQAVPAAPRRWRIAGGPGQDPPHRPLLR